MLPEEITRLSWYKFTQFIQTTNNERDITMKPDSTAAKLLARLKILIVAGAIVPLAAMAAGSATLESDGDTMQVMWQDTETARFGQVDDDSYMLVQSGKIYLVTHESGEPQVLDIGDMAQMFLAFLDEDTLAEVVPDKLDSVKATGKTETIAGITGEVYEISFTTGSGEKDQREAVLTDDKTITELTDVALNTFRTLTAMPELGQFIDALPKNRRGILRLDDSHVLASVSSEKPDDSFFELPSKPQGLQDLMKGLAEMLEQATGN